MRNEEVRLLLDEEHDRLARARDALLRDGLAEDTQRGGTGELSGMDEHVADVATETFDREVELGVLHEVDAELVEVRRALERVAAGTYGTCRMCGEAIAEERLRAVPATTLCRAHQDVAELADAALRDARGHGAPEQEAAAHLDLLPDDDRPPTPPGAEEAAVHPVPTRW
jgi:RNA polymerase-binding transcription factor DksA